jgi:hypothetical protein
MLYAVKLTTTIDRSRRVVLQLPANTPEGEAEIIILFNDKDEVDRRREGQAEPAKAVRDSSEETDQDPASTDVHLNR